MLETFTALLLAHVIADFVAQTGWMVAGKTRFAPMALHIAIVLATAVIATGTVAWPLAALAVAHLVIDLAKTHSRATGLAPFLIDQAAHVATLIAVAVVAPGLWQAGLWSAQGWLLPLMAATAGFVLATRAGGFAIGLLMAPWSGTELPEGLVNGGRLIGLLERGLIFLLVLVGQPAGVGFLIAAKSVLRFDTTSHDRRASEYVIIGTLASFGWALASSFAALALIQALGGLPILETCPRHLNV